jgi:uncharacterized membrane protein YfcA
MPDIGALIEVAALVVFVPLPFVLGYATKRYAAAALPALSLAAAVINAVTYHPSGPSDEVDVIPPMFVLLSAVATIGCLLGALIGRRRSRRRPAAT